MIDSIRTVAVHGDDRLHIAVSAPAQSFRYEIIRYLSDGAGGFEDGQTVGAGDNAHVQWIGGGSELAGALVKACVTHGDASASRHEIVVRLLRESGAGVLEDVATWRIAPGLDAGDYKCITLQF